MSFILEILILIHDHKNYEIYLIDTEASIGVKSSSVVQLIQQRLVLLVLTRKTMPSARNEKNMDEVYEVVV